MKPQPSVLPLFAGVLIVACHEPNDAPRKSEEVHVTAAEISRGTTPDRAFERGLTDDEILGRNVGALHMRIDARIGELQAEVKRLRAEVPESTGMGKEILGIALLEAENRLSVLRGDARELSTLDRDEWSAFQVRAEQDLQ